MNRRAITSSSLHLLMKRCFSQSKRQPPFKISQRKDRGKVQSPPVGDIVALIKANTLEQALEKTQRDNKLDKRSRKKLYQRIAIESENSDTSFRALSLLLQDPNLHIPSRFRIITVVDTLGKKRDIGGVMAVYLRLCSSAQIESHIVPLRKTIPKPIYKVPKFVVVPLFDIRIHEFSVVMTACARTGSIDLLKAIMLDLSDSNVTPTETTVESLIHCLCQNEQIDLVQMQQVTHDLVTILKLDIWSVGVLVIREWWAKKNFSSLFPMFFYLIDQREILNLLSIPQPPIRIIALAMNAAPMLAKRNMLLQIISWAHSNLASPNFGQPNQETTNETNPPSPFKLRVYFLIRLLYRSSFLGDTESSLMLSKSLFSLTQNNPLIVHHTLLQVEPAYQNYIDQPSFSPSITPCQWIFDRAMLSCVSAHRLDLAIHTIGMIQTNKVPLTSTSYYAVILCCVPHHAIDIALHWLKRMIDHRILVKQDHVNRILEMLAHHGHGETAETLLREMDERSRVSSEIKVSFSDIVAQAHLMTAYLRSGNSRKAFSIFSNVLWKALNRSKHRKQNQGPATEIIKSSGSQLMIALANLEEVDMAKTVFDSLIALKADLSLSDNVRIGVMLANSNQISNALDVVGRILSRQGEYSQKAANEVIKQIVKSCSISREKKHAQQVLEFVKSRGWSEEDITSQFQQFGLLV